MFKKTFFMIIFLTIFLLLSLSGCSKQYKPLEKGKEFKSETQRQSMNTIMYDVNALANIKMEGRQPGTAGEQKAADYLSKRLRSIDLIPLGEEEYKQYFNVPEFKRKFEDSRLVYFRTEKKGLNTKCINVLGKLPGNDDKVIIISAHYDHVGIFDNKVYRGANDNASGVACVLDVITRLKKGNKNKRSTIIVAFWSAEEMGFWGSEAFVENPPIELKKIKAVFNVDTIGNGMIDAFSYWGENNNDAVITLKKTSDKVGLKLIKAPKDGHNSDQITFEKLGIPAVTIISPDWLENNQSLRDTPELVNYNKVKKASDFIYQAVKLISIKEF